MLNIEELMDIVGQTISERKQGDVFFSTMDLTYAYGQLPGKYGQNKFAQS